MMNQQKYSGDPVALAGLDRRRVPANFQARQAGASAVIWIAKRIAKWMAKRNAKRNAKRIDA
jgi:hypothetical protein